MTTANRWLTLFVVLLAMAAALGGALSWRTHGDRADAATSQERYGAVLRAADAEVTAFVNLRYDNATRTVRAVAAGATGAFRAEYARSSGRVVRALRSSRSRMEGHVVWAGVSALSPDRATVIVATTGSVSNRRTHGKPVPRRFRLRVELVHSAGRWLTSGLAFVGSGP